MIASRPRIPERRETFCNVLLITCLAAVLIVFPKLCYGDDLVRRLELLREQYQNLPAIHFRTSSIMLQSEAEMGGKKRRVKSLYEYWGKDAKYRINSSLHPEDKQANGLITQVAYDGNRFQHLDIPNSILNLWKEDIDIIPKIPPNPMLYPVIFFSPGLNEPGARLKFKDLYDDKLWASMLGSAKIVSDSSPGRELVFELPGGYEKGIRCVFHVHFGTDPDFMPVKIARVSEDGSELVIFAIEEYQVIEFGGKKTYWPKSVRCEDLVDGKVTYEEKMAIEALEVGKELPHGIFTIDFTLADLVWDNDHKVALKTQNSNLAFPEIPTNINFDTQYTSDAEAEAKEKKTNVVPDTLANLQLENGTGILEPEVKPLAVTKGKKRQIIWLTVLCMALIATIVYTIFISGQNKKFRKTME